MPKLFMTLQDELERLDKENGTHYAGKHVTEWEFNRPLIIGLALLHLPLIIKAIIINL
jgi:hypothetical protein